MRIQLRNPSREVELRGPMSVVAVLNRLELNRESVLVVQNGTLVPGDAMLADDDVIEVRPVISGGAFDTAGRRASRPGAGTTPRTAP
ncbi:MAG: MoaD/ThiS family protein [Actinomycetota bacterium]|nr:MoaD/ThiS family protein [Actinomycetota bacterium]